MSAPGRTVAAMIGVWLACSFMAWQASAEQADQQAAAAPLAEGWVRKSFDFGVEALDFEAAVPAGTSVETTAMKPRETGTAGKIVIVGKVYPAKTGLPVEVTIQAFDLAVPAVASRICAHEAEIAGYTPRGRRATPDLSEAELFATKSDGNKPAGGVFSRCMTRGDKVLVTHFLFDVSGVTDKKELENRTSQAQDYYKTFISSIVFADGQSPGYRDTLREIPVTIGRDQVRLNVPDVWQVPINDFRGPLPAELHLLRKNDSGADTGLLWLWVEERSGQPDLEELAPRLIGNYFVRQSPDAAHPELLSVGEDPELREAGIVSRSFRFSAKNKAGEDIGEILATAFWHDKRLYVLSLWSHWTPAADRNIFFSRLPGLTAFDLISAKLAGVMKENR